MKEFPSGRLEIRAHNAINSEASLGTAAKKAAEQNSSQNLRKFFDPLSCDVLDLDLTDGGVTSTYKPSGPYADISILIISAPHHSLQRKEAVTEQIYDYSFDLQENHWKRVLSTMVATANHPLIINSDSQIYATENCIESISNQNQRNSRTISLPHAQVFALDQSVIKPDNTNFNHLTRERKWTQRYIADFLDQLKTHLPSIELSARVSNPTGYEFSFNENAYGLLANISFVAQTLRDHHIAFAKVAKMWKKQIDKLDKPYFQNLIQAPSYRLYLYDGDKGLEVTISPEFISHAGVLEAAGLHLHRASFHPKRYPNDRVILEEITNNARHLTITNAQNSQVA